MPSPAETPAMPEFGYPLFLRLEGMPVVVVGGGKVAARKVRQLLDLGARVKVVSPTLDALLAQDRAAGAFEWVRRSFQKGDLAGALLVVSATDDRSVNESVHAEAVERGQLVNVVDVPDLCNAIVPSVMRRGRLQVAVSTDGASPSVAREVRLQLEDEFALWWEDYLDLMAELRCLVKARVPGPMERRAPVYAAIQRSDLRQRCENGEAVSAEEAYGRIVAPLLAGGAL